jgi:hypothetical protein
MATKDRTGAEDNLIFKKIMNDVPVSEKEMLVSGVLPQLTKKVS